MITYENNVFDLALFYKQISFTFFVATALPLLSLAARKCLFMLPKLCTSQKLFRNRMLNKEKRPRTMGCDYFKQNYASDFFNKLPSIHSITCQLDVTTSYDDIVANSFYSQIYIILSHSTSLN